MRESAYLFTGWEFNNSITNEQFANGEIYAQLDLGGATPIDEMTVSYLPASNQLNDQNYSIATVPKEYRFEGSNDGIEYTTIKTVITDLSEYKDTVTTKEEYLAVIADPAVYDLMRTHRVIFDETINYRYIRFVMVQPTQDWAYEAGDRNSKITDWQLYTYNTWKDAENEASSVIAPKDANGVYQFSNNGSNRNIIGFSGEEGLSSKAASRVTYKDETIGRDWNLDEGAIQSSNGNFALSTSTYSNYTDENVYLQYDFGYPTRVDVIEQNFRNCEDATKANDVPKTIRIDYGSKNARGVTEWTKGEVFTFDMSSAASVGEKTAAAYNNLIANGSVTTAEAMYLTQPTRLELANPVVARYLRIVYLQPTQNGSLPTDNKLKIKKTQLINLEGLADSNTLAADVQVPFNDDGSVKFTSNGSDNIRYVGEDPAEYTVSRLRATQYITWKDWYYRHLIERHNSSWTGLQARPADFVNEKIALEYDFGAPIDIDSFLVEYKTYQEGNNAGSIYNKKASNYNDVPAKVRFDYGVVDASNKISWTKGKTFTYDLESYELLSQYTTDELVAAYNTAEEERTDLQKQLVAAVDAVPTEMTYDLGFKNARFLRMVIIDPLQSGMENNTSDKYTWYLYSTTVFGANPVVETSATITAATANSVTYDVTLAEADANAVVFVALYKGDNLVGVKKIEAGADTATFTAVSADKAKVFVWEDITRIRPITMDEYEIK